MKTYTLLFALAFGLLLSSCEKNDEIFFPPNGLHGPNLLSKGASSAIPANENFSMRADLNKQSRLKVVITNTSNYTGPASNAPLWMISGENEWNVSSYQGHMQEFTTTRRATRADLAIKFINSPGNARIDFYVNSSQITRTIMVNW